MRGNPGAMVHPALATSGSVRKYIEWNFSMTTYYVSSSLGRASNSGTSASLPFATIQQAADRTLPGDKVEVMAGTYSVDAATGYVLQTSHSGTAGAPIVYEGYNGARPIISLPNGGVAAFQINASYVTIQGFEFVGNAQSVSLSQAQNLAAQPGSGSNRTITANGVVVNWNGNSTVHHHVSILNNIVHDFPGAGISTTKADYITVQGNAVYNNAKYSPWGTSGITLYGSHDVDGVIGYKNWVIGNVIHDNQQLVNSYAIGQPNNISDGEGLLIDDNSNDQTDNVQYHGRTLIANNVSYNNGAAGLAATASSNVDFLYNTSYGNDPTGTRGGQIGASRLTGGTVANNIAVAGPNGTTIQFGGSNTGITEDYNVVYGGRNTATGAHNIVADPRFTDPRAANFLPQAGSPALDSANSAYTVPTDQQGNARPANGAYDRGALERQQVVSPPPPTPIPTPTPTTDKLDLAIAQDAYRGDAQFTVSVDGKQVGGTLTAHALHSSGADEHFILSGSWGAGAHAVTVAFINDAWGGTAATDRNLYLDSVAFNGTTYANTAAVLLSNGSRSVQVGGAAPTAPSDSNVLTLHLSEDAYNGDASFQVSVDGKTITTPQTVEALHSADAFQDFSFGGFGPGTHDVGVTFLNDAWGGTAATDRNLYVESIDFGSHHFDTNAALWSSGTQHFTVS